MLYALGAMLLFAYYRALILTVSRTTPHSEAEAILIWIAFIIPPLIVLAVILWRRRARIVSGAGDATIGALAGIVRAKRGLQKRINDRI